MPEDTPDYSEIADTDEIVLRASEIVREFGSPPMLMFGTPQMSARMAEWGDLATRLGLGRRLRDVPVLRDAPPKTKHEAKPAVRSCFNCAYYVPAPHNACNAFHDRPADTWEVFSDRNCSDWEGKSVSGDHPDVSNNVSNGSIWWA